MGRIGARQVGLGAALLLLLALVLLIITAVLAVRRPFPDVDGAVRR